MGIVISNMEALNYRIVLVDLYEYCSDSDIGAEYYLQNSWKMFQRSRNHKIEIDVCTIETYDLYVYM